MVKQTYHIDFQYDEELHVQDIIGFASSFDVLTESDRCLN